MSHYALILAAGKGSRLANSKVPKQFLPINNLPIVMHSLSVFHSCLPNCELYLGLPSYYDSSLWEQFCANYNFTIKHKIYKGGDSRALSVLAGLQAIKNSIRKKPKDKINIVSIHDAARPFVDKGFIQSLIKPFKNTHIKAVLPTTGLKNSIIKKRTKHQYQSVNRSEFLLCQTPQCFEFECIYKAYLSYIKALQISPSQTEIMHDDFSVFMQYYVPKVKHLTSPSSMIKYMEGRDYNIKITTELDYAVAEEIYNLLKGENNHG